MRDRRASAVGLVFAAACSVQGGAAVAKSLFPQLGPPGVVFLRSSAIAGAPTCG